MFGDSFKIKSVGFCMHAGADKGKTYFKIFTRFIWLGLFKACVSWIPEVCLCPRPNPILQVSQNRQFLGYSDLWGMNSLFSANLQQLCGSICQTELPQHSQLQLVADRGSFAAVEGVRSLDLLRVSQLLEPADHVLHHRQWWHWKTHRYGNKCSYVLIWRYLIIEVKTALLTSNIIFGFSGNSEKATNRNHVSEYLRSFWICSYISTVLFPFSYLGFHWPQLRALLLSFLLFAGGWSCDSIEARHCWPCRVCLGHSTYALSANAPCPPAPPSSHQVQTEDR